MLHSIRVRNFAIIKDLLLDFKNGLNLLTGETGAGKSIIIDALEMLLGERSSASLIRSGEDKAIVEGVFQENDAEIKKILERAGIQNSKELIIKREISASGGSKVFINGEIATINALKALGHFLVNIHGQHQHQSLLNQQAHLSILDRFGENEQLKDKIQKIANDLTDHLSEFQKLQNDMMQREQKLDFLKFQVEEIEKCSPKPEEDIKLHQERVMLRNIEILKNIVKESYSITYEDDRSILTLLKKVKKNMEKLSDIDTQFRQFDSGLDEAIFESEELSLFLRDYFDRLNLDPDRISYVEDRLAELERLKRKYGKTIGDILAFKEKNLQRIEDLMRVDEDSENRKGKIKDHYCRYCELAQQLTEKRRKDATRFSAYLLEQLQELAMDKSRFQVKFDSMELQDDVDFEKDISVRPDGVDKIEFLISVNVGEELKPLNKVASGGELSRIMLAINSLMKKRRDSRTLIFDEVDAGIGGRVASVVGKKLKSISKNNQVICVTHLPQIASYADYHIKVVKKVQQKRTVVHVSILNEEEKVEEIARMIAGEKISETSLRHAEEMVKSYGRRRP